MIIFNVANSEVAELPEATPFEIVIAWLFIAVLLGYIVTFILLMTISSPLSDYRLAKVLIVIFLTVATVLLVLLYFRLLGKYELLFSFIFYVLVYTVYAVKLRRKHKQTFSDAQKMINEQEKNTQKTLEDIWKRSVARQEERLKKFAEEKELQDASDYKKWDGLASDIQNSWSEDSTKN